MAVQTPAEVAASPVGRSAGLRQLAALLWRRPWLIAAVLSALVLVLPVTGGDLAAQDFHTWVFQARGAVLWNNYWYGGHLLGGYSLLFPPIAAVVGTRLLGALAVVASAWAAGALFLTPAASRATRLAVLWFDLGCLGPLLVGQLPFGVAVAMALSAWLAATRGRPGLAAVAALAASLTSPLAGAFLLMLALAWCAEVGVRRAGPLAAAAIGVGISPLLGSGGYFPFNVGSLVSILILCAGGLTLVPGLSRTLRVAFVLYAASSIAIFAVQNPVGGNVGRLGALVGGPLALALLGTRRRWWTLAVLVVPLLLWQIWPAVTAVARSDDDASSQASYYAGLNAFLRTQDPAQGRLEIPTLRQHWEAYYVAKVFPLARGWERQLDLRDNQVLYQPGLTAAQLHAWMLDSGVGLVALPNAPMDYWSRDEAALLAAGQPWLRPVWSDPHWQVWRVTDSGGLVSGPARMTRLGVDSFDLSASAPGASVVRLHWSPYWRVTSGRACLQPGPGRWMTVRADQPGAVSVTASWSLTAAVHPSAAGSRCR